MSDRERSRQPGRRRTAEEAGEVDETVEAAAPVAEDIDDLLDEIDSVLEENAEEFVKNYVQKGGE